MAIDGVILKGIGGFYYVRTDEGVFECKAKGKFRKERITPLAGDKVSVTIRNDEENTIDEIYERKNFLIRPPVANIDKLFIVVSAAKPKPNTVIIDKMTVLAEKNNITPVVVITKTDLANHDELKAVYETTGYKVYSFSVEDHSELDNIKNELSGCLCAFTGNSGVGKSTLINALSGNLQLETGEISDKLGRGRHTTRQAEVFPVGDGLVIDTAGFSSIDFTVDNRIYSDELQYYFREFSEHIDECRFTGCRHIGDKGCRICELIQSGEISTSRHESYKAILSEIKDNKKWDV
ncbi:MAG: ribosome small subunit-dependent GTPase A [Clostridia bacterium]|nr:ribosome small subunit-dependent GTPase A [Clostridia bacterium]